MPSDPVLLLRRHLGYEAFRSGQEELVRSIIAGRDALGILPTGGGKSVCYQVPALALSGLTLVVTPLVSLMEDQVARALGAGLRAAHLSAAQSTAERKRTLAKVTSGGLDILFVAPERLELAAFRDALSGADVRLLAVDEAHSISEWGQDFRPAYRRIGVLRRMLDCPTLALTATATPAVREDILRSLALNRPLVVVRSFDRPNLSWSVRRGRSLQDRVADVHALLRRLPGCSIVYAPTRRAVERVRDGLADRGLATEAYHAGLPGPERSRVQAAFMEGACRVVVATNAFGMGIDKADVRTVVHVQLPGTLEAYYQEAGRAGRDGGAAHCVAYHERADRRLSKLFVDRTHPPVKQLRALHRRLRRHADPEGHVRLDRPGVAWAGPFVEEWIENTGTGILAALERTGSIRRISRVDGAMIGTAAATSTISDPTVGDEPFAPVLGVRPRLTVEPAARLRRAALSKVDAVQRYAHTRRCRRRALLRYFGESAPPRCENCDRCGAQRA